MSRKQNSAESSSSAHESTLITCTPKFQGNFRGLAISSLKWHRPDSPRFSNTDTVSYAPVHQWCALQTSEGSPKLAV
ncbi:hypothetical protein RSAG8_05978, partial [Rhizoctonia solani AG-8 WAC10335]